MSFLSAHFQSLQIIHLYGGYFPRKRPKSHVLERHLKKSSVVGVDLAAIPSEQFSSECLSPIEVSDLLFYLVLGTSYYTNKQRPSKVWKRTTRWFLEIAGEIVVVAKVRHSQRMNDPLVNIWIIAEKDGAIIKEQSLGVC